MRRAGMQAMGATDRTHSLRIAAIPCWYEHAKDRLVHEPPDNLTPLLPCVSNET
jgi:hypothetical protein